MTLQPEDLDDPAKFRQIFSVQYCDLVPFIFGYLKKSSILTFLFWSICTASLGIAVIVRVRISGYYPMPNILFHTFLGLIIFPLACIPIHESLHILPYFISGARKIRVGIDLKQYLFYVTAHRYVATALQFIIVAIIPFVLISISSVLIVLLVPGLWKWSFSLFLFAHSTMCAGDFALINFYFMNRDKKIYTWDDADRKIAYFYEEIVKNEYQEKSSTGKKDQYN